MCHFILLPSLYASEKYRYTSPACGSYGGAFDIQGTDATTGLISQKKPKKAMQSNVMKRCFFLWENTTNLFLLFNAMWLLKITFINAACLHTLKSARKNFKKLKLLAQTCFHIKETCWILYSASTSCFGCFFNCLYPVFLLIPRSTLQSLNLLMCSSAFSMYCWKYLSLLTKASNIKSLHLRV